MQILDGKRVANDIKNVAKHLIDNNNCNIKLVVIQVGNDTASSVYIRNKQIACEYVGIMSTTHYFDEDVSQEELEGYIDSLNNDDSVTGILVQLPLPPHLDEWRVVNRIDPRKDVDGFTAVNAGKLARNHYDFSRIVPCTPYGIMLLLNDYHIDVKGKHCVVVGRSNIVGRPMAEMLLNRDATVTMCHSHTKNLAEICKSADILICAVGKPRFFTKDYIKDGAVVIDVGMHRVENGKLCGDVDFDDVKDMDIKITPVPGGVGPLTVATLMFNCISAYLSTTRKTVIR